MEVFELQGEYMLKMSDEEFYHFCRDNSELRIERNANGEIEIKSPTGYLTGDLNSEINLQLRLWNKQKQMGRVLDSSAGFKLPDSAIRSPDAAFVSNKKDEDIDEALKKQFAPVCPDFVIELKTGSDTLNRLKSKMQEWISNGCRLAWLIDPVPEKVLIYREDGSRDEVHGFDQKLSGEAILPGFELDLKELEIK